MTITLSDCILHIYPHLKPNEDFLVLNNLDEKGPFIAKWNVEDTQPSNEQLKEALTYIQANPPKPTKSEIEELKEQQALMQQAIDDLILGGMF